MAKVQRGVKEKRTLTTLDDDLCRFQNEFNEFCNNVIGERLFNVPLNQVYNKSLFTESIFKTSYNWPSFEIIEITIYNNEKTR